MMRDKSKQWARIDRLLGANKTHIKTTASWAKGATLATLVAASMSVPALAMGNLATANDSSNASNSASNRSSNSAGNGTNNSASDDIKNDSNDQSVGDFYHQNGAHEIRASWDGAFSLTDDESTLASLKAGGTFKITEKGKGPTRKIKFSNKNGQLHSRFSIDRQKRQMNAQDKQWLADVLLRFLRSSGEFAEQRVTRIISTGGVSAVLDEMAFVSSSALYDYTKALLGKKTPDAKQTRKLLTLLEKISSDHTMRQTYGLVIAQARLSKPVVEDILSGAKEIQSDYEMRMLLETLLKQRQLDDALFADLLDLSESIQSDYEMRMLLSAALKQKGLSHTSLIRLMAVAEDEISSDFELRELISEFAQHHKDSGPAIGAAIDALSAISSDFEQRMAVSSIAQNANLDTRHWLKLIDSIDDISSDTEATEALLLILKVIPQDKKLLEAVTYAVEEGISSSRQQARLEKALM